MREEIPSKQNSKEILNIEVMFVELPVCLLSLPNNFSIYWTILPICYIAILLCLFLSYNIIYRITFLTKTYRKQNSTSK